MLAQSNQPEQIATALEYFRDRPEKDSLAELTKSLVSLSDRFPNFIDEATNLARELRFSASDSGDDDRIAEVENAYKSLLLKRVLVTIDTEGPTDFTKLLTYCEAASAAEIDDPILAVCKAECLVSDTATSKDPAGRERRLATH